VRDTQDSHYVAQMVANITKHGGIDMRFTDLNRGKVVCLVGSGAAVVETIYWQEGKYMARFRCEDGLAVVLTQSEEFMIRPLSDRLRSDANLGGAPLPRRLGFWILNNEYTHE
jgi:hypothetical protein